MSNYFRNTTLVWVALAGGVIVYLGIDLGRSEFFLERAERLQDGEPGLGGVALLARARELDARNPGIFLAGARAWEARAEGLSPGARRSFLERARVDYEEACRLHPFNIYALVPLANCLDSLGMGDAARARYEEAMRWAPRFQYCLLSYGMFLHRSGDWDGAEEVYRRCHRAHALEDIDGSMARVRELEAMLARDRKRGSTRSAPP